MAIIGVCIQYSPFLPIYRQALIKQNRPWQLVATAEKFLSVLSGFGVVMAPLTYTLPSKTLHVIQHN